MNEQQNTDTIDSSNKGYYSWLGETFLIPSLILPINPKYTKPIWVI